MKKIDDVARASGPERIRDAANATSSHATPLIAAGVSLFLLGLFNGLLVHFTTVPRVTIAAPAQALAAHLVALMSGTFLIAVGLLWPRLRLSRMASLFGVALALYSFYAGWAFNLLAGIWGAPSVLPLSAAAAHGSALQESLIGTGLFTVALGTIAFCLLVLWGLRPAIAHAP